MGQIAQLIAKIVFASTVSVFLWINAGMYSYAAYIDASIDEIENGNMANSAQPSSSSASDMAADAVPDENQEVEGDKEHNISIEQFADTENRNVAPDGVPAAIGQADGSVYSYQEEITDDNGDSAYVYSSGEDVTFDDGGLGDAELIIN